MSNPNSRKRYLLVLDAEQWNQAQETAHQLSVPMAVLIRSALNDFLIRFQNHNSRKD